MLQGLLLGQALLEICIKRGDVAKKGSICSKNKISSLPPLFLRLLGSGEDDKKINLRQTSEKNVMTANKILLRPLQA